MVFVAGVYYCHLHDSYDHAVVLLKWPVELVGPQVRLFEDLFPHGEVDVINLQGPAYLVGMQTSRNGVPSASPANSADLAWADMFKKLSRRRRWPVAGVRPGRDLFLQSLHQRRLSRTLWSLQAGSTIRSYSPVGFSERFPAAPGAPIKVNLRGYFVGPLVDAFCPLGLPALPGVFFLEDGTLILFARALSSRFASACFLLSLDIGPLVPASLPSAVPAILCAIFRIPPATSTTLRTTPDQYRQHPHPGHAGAAVRRGTSQVRFQAVWLGSKESYQNFDK